MLASAWESLSELVLVAGHAVLRQAGAPDLLDEAAWVLQPFQRGEVPYFVEHVRAGVEQARINPAALLVFSGGQTRPEAGPISEAGSCFAVAQRFAWWGAHGVRLRATTEEFARDSFENLLFGICRFRECCGALPSRVVVVGWEFKRRRFELHRAALGLPPDRFRYVGANDPPRHDDALRGELVHGIEPFERDPMGARCPLADKRRMRNPSRRHHGYLQSCPELRELLVSSEPLPPDRLPW